MRTSTRLPLYLAGGAAAIALAIGGGIVASQSGGGKPAANSSPVSGATVQTRNTGLGNILVDSKGRTVYLFTKDMGNSATCTGTCLSYWPPVQANGNLQVGGGASATQLATITTPGGGHQLSYAGHPLYYFVGDHKAGDTSGEALDQFGGLWYALAPNGSAVTQATANAGNGGGGGYGY